MSKGKVIVGVVLILAILVSAFYYLEFAFAQSESRTDSSVSTYSSASAQEMLRAQPGRKLTIFVAGRGPIAASLGKELQKDLAQNSIFAEVVFDPIPGVSAAGDVLRVEVESVNTLWSGAYSRAQVKATASYSTTGQVDWSSQRVPQLYSPTPAVMIHGSYTMEDTSRGLISLNGYSADLGRRLAHEIGKSLTAEINRQAQAA